MREHHTASKNSQATNYSYDENGNRLTRDTGSTLKASTYNSRDQLLTSGQFQYSYNANGERTSKVDTASNEITTYEYDVFGNLIAVNLPTGTRITYVIDGLNRRVGKKINGQLKQGYIYQDQLRIAARYDVDPTPRIVEIFVYPNKSNVPEVMFDLYQASQGIRRIISDERGTPKLVVNTHDGSIVEEISTDEFGRVLSDSKPDYFPFKFAGCLYDEDTKLCHFGAREYDPEEGRWLQRDPIGFDGGETNLYGYALQDPVNATDLTGRDTDWDGVSKCLSNLLLPFESPVGAIESGGAAISVAGCASIRNPELKAACFAGLGAVEAINFTAAAAACIENNQKPTCDPSIMCCAQ